MKRPFGKFAGAAVAILVLASFAMAPYADAAGRGGGADLDQRLVVLPLA